MIGSSAIGNAEVGGVTITKLVSEMLVASDNFINANGYSVTAGHLMNLSSAEPNSINITVDQLNIGTSNTDQNPFDLRIGHLLNSTNTDQNGFDLSVDQPTIGVTSAESNEFNLTIEQSFGSANSNGNEFNITVGHLREISDVNGNGFNVTVGHIVGSSDTNIYLAESYIFNSDPTSVASATINALTFSTLPILGFGSATADALNLGDAEYFIVGAPNLVVFRNAANLTETELNILNPRDFYGIKVYRSDGRREPFYEHELHPTLPWTDSNINSGSDYRYKASFFTTGSKNGQTVDIESRKSKVRYTKGK